MGIVNRFADGIASLTNSLVNQRDVTNTNRVWHKKIDEEELRQISKTGLMSKITRLKSGMAMNDTFEFDSEEDRKHFEQIEPQVKRAVKHMINYGRGLIVFHEKCADLSLPLPNDIKEREYKLDVFSGDIVNVVSAQRNLSSRNYLKPTTYYVRGFPVHPSRVIDFTYVEPPEYEADIYHYGGIPEAELIYDQLINDGVVERATPGILEKSSSVFYKVTGFKNLLRNNQEGDVVRYFRHMESNRHVLGASLMDSDDEVHSIDQTLSNLSETDNITLRRLAMVTGIPLSWLVGEAVKGLNSSGEIENDVMRATVDSLISDYIIHPLNTLLKTMGVGPAKVIKNRGEDPSTKATTENTVANTAMLMAQLGQDFESYLEQWGMVKKDEFEAAFSDSWEPPEVD